MSRCVDCLKIINKPPRGRTPLRCKECSITENRKRTLEHRRKIRGVPEVRLCKVCKKPILDRGRSGNRQTHPECLPENILKAKQRATKKRLYESTSGKIKIKKEFFNMSDLQKASPDKAARMIGTMERQ